MNASMQRKNFKNLRTTSEQSTLTESQSHTRQMTTTSVRRYFHD